MQEKISDKNKSSFSAIEKPYQIRRNAAKLEQEGKIIARLR